MLKKILLIDDEADFCFFIKQNLMRLGGVDVSYANDPDEGIKIARKIIPDIILLDVMMPKKSGLEVMKILKKDKKTMAIPIVMLTAVQDDQTKTTAYELYGEDYLLKPIAFDDLKEKIEEIFRRQSAFGK
ncbi:MAG: response regulator [Candidatus Omnitrophota bacterium]